eukprot:6989465-Prymnesium_polylepis.1
MPTRCPRCPGACSSRPRRAARKTPTRRVPGSPPSRASPSRAATCTRCGVSAVRCHTAVGCPSAARRSAASGGTARQRWPPYTSRAPPRRLPRAAPSRRSPLPASAAIATHAPLPSPYGSRPWALSASRARRATRRCPSHRCPSPPAPPWVERCSCLAARQQAGNPMSRAPQAAGPASPSHLRGSPLQPHAAAAVGTRRRAPLRTHGTRHSSQTARPMRRAAGRGAADAARSPRCDARTATRRP